MTEIKRMRIGTCVDGDFDIRVSKPGVNVATVHREDAAFSAIDAPLRSRPTLTGSIPAASLGTSTLDITQSVTIPFGETFADFPVARVRVQDHFTPPGGWRWLDGATAGVKNTFNDVTYEHRWYSEYYQVYRDQIIITRKGHINTITQRSVILSWSAANDMGVVNIGGTNYDLAPYFAAFAYPASYQVFLGIA